MSDGFQNLRLERNTAGIATVSFDVQGSPVNIFTDAVFRELSGVVEQLERDPPRLVLFRSAKPSGFMAGADVHHIQRMRSEAEVRTVLAAGHELFERLESLKFPTVAVIHGPCLGGGLEFALACRYRLARDDGPTKIGLPEVLLGLIPGWGGTQRLPRLVGLRQALRMILEGATLSASKALSVGLIDRAFSGAEFDTGVDRFVEERLAGRPVARPTSGLLGTLLDGTRPGRAMVFRSARKRIAKRAHDYPALPAALRAIRSGYQQPGRAGFACERDEFARVVFTPTASNLIELFLTRERARKPATWVTQGHKPSPVRKVAVVGAGVMGAGIAQLVALSGFPVVLKDINDELVASGMKKIEGLTQDAVHKGALAPAEAETALRGITPTSSWEPLVGADLVIEAVVEREDVKREVFHQLAEQLQHAPVLASNTSALSVARLAQAVGHPERVAGLHFFNPVHRMQLVEVVRAPATDDHTVATLVDFVRKLGKVPVVVADSPGFLVNRVLFPYIDEAVRLLLEGVPGPEIDRAAVRFGMPMGPLELVDQVGVDIAADVSRTFGPFRGGDLGPAPERLAEMVRAGALGKKVGHGFYEYRNDRRGKPTRWALPTNPQHAPRGNEGDGLSELQKRLIYPMINEAAKCLESAVVHEPWVIDLAMVLGTGFAPFRGGPLHLADAIGLGALVGDLERLRSTHGARFEPAALLRTRAADGHGFMMDEAHTREHEEVHR
jgi:3-hydroxyacyl-CoA dehydrogenase/enoyl-CoA hydratase/3-hydroxybutyryl-CoA epimerase